jgi:hypothetical protein
MYKMLKTYIVQNNKEVRDSVTFNICHKWLIYYEGKFTEKMWLKINVFHTTNEQEKHRKKMQHIKVII